MPENIEIRSEQVQEVLRFVPNWMIRWGNTAILLIVIGLLFISWVIKYPDTIPAEVLITPRFPLEYIRTNVGGSMDTLCVQNGDHVKKGTVLGIIKNDANYQHVQILKQILDSLKVNGSAFHFPIERTHTLILGDLQTDYNKFEQAYLDCVMENSLEWLNNPTDENPQIHSAKIQLNHLWSQKLKDKKKLDFEKGELEQLYKSLKRGNVSRQEYNQKSLLYGTNQAEYDKLTSSISKQKKLILKLIAETKNPLGVGDNGIKDAESLTKLHGALERLREGINIWENNYILVSSIHGIVASTHPQDENSEFLQDELVFTVRPNGGQQFMGTIDTPSKNLGKISVGRDVRIRLNEYPVEEFGLLLGKINSISQAPNSDGNYTLKLEFPNQLVTTYHRKISYEDTLQGTAEILVEDKRLAERIFYQLRNIFNSP